jgi:3-hydroxymyristoyl/3-hydroxydecanoyl-(acyl carrier protein) dehydratase
MRWQLVDTIEELILNESVWGTKTYDPSEEFFQDHFPGFPVVPGVLIMESLAQISGKLIGYTVRQTRGDWPFPILSMMNRVKFRKFIPPGASIRLEAQIGELRRDFCSVQVKARLGTKVHAQAEQIFVFNAVPLADEAEKERVEALEQAALQRLWAGWTP